MLTNALLPIAFGAVGMVSAFLIYANILKTPSGEGRVKKLQMKFILAPWSLWQVSTSAWESFA